jgi:transcriptional regulator with XRE-family HTH domain
MATMAKQRLCEAIKIMRLTQCLSLRDVANMMDCSHVYLMEVERGHKRPSPQWLKTWCAATGTNYRVVAEMAVSEWSEWDASEMRARYLP